MSVPPATTRAEYLGGVFERLRVIVVAGVGLGVLVGGIGGRLAMLLLRVTSDDSVRGVLSDDGFVIGRVTLGGTYALLALGAAVGIIGAAVVGVVEPFLLGPRWFHAVTCALGAGAVVGAMLVHTDGVDFTLLQPTWLAVGLFIAIPALFGGLIGPLRRAVARPGSWTARGKRRWLLPLLATVCFPVTLFVLALVTPLVALAVAARPAGEATAMNARVRVALRAGWLGVATLGLLALVSDVRGLA